MDVDKMKQELAKRLSGERYDHVLRVSETAKSLADRYALSVMAAEQAALFHDIAKCMEVAELRRVLEKDNGDERYLPFHPELWHAPAGSTIARDEFGIDDQDVLNAIRYHTTGRAHMSQLEKLIYVADMIEPVRTFPGVDQLREIATQSLDAAMEACIHQSVQFLVNKRVPVFPDSIDCYNEMITTKSTRTRQPERN